MSLPERFLVFVEARSRVAVVLVCVLAITSIGIIDYFAGERLSFVVFYLAPVTIIAWRLGPLWGSTAAAAAALVSVTADSMNRHVTLYADGINYWNFATHAGIFVGAVLTLSALRRTIDKEKDLARIDALTESANRRAFDELAESELRRGRRYAHPLTRVYVDVDDLKLVNDTFGHDQGDALLRTVAGLLRDNFRETDVVARLGGDEFCVLLSETDARAAEVVTAKLHGAVQAAAAQARWPLSLSIGAVTFSTMPANTDEMLRQADGIMYAVKTSGKNAVRLVAA
ncbi:MAG: GGDEF domain-containing protein [Thermoleophilia bacterium]